MGASYTLVLTRGTHVVSVATGQLIHDALEMKQPTVTVDIDFHCNGDFSRGVVLATAHIIALVPYESAREDDDIPFGANVMPFRQAGSVR